MGRRWWLVLLSAALSVAGTVDMGFGAARGYGPQAFGGAVVLAMGLGCGIVVALSWTRL